MQFLNFDDSKYSREKSYVIQILISLIFVKRRHLATVQCKLHKLKQWLTSDCLLTIGMPLKLLLLAIILETTFILLLTIVNIIFIELLLLLLSLFTGIIVNISMFSKYYFQRKCRTKKEKKQAKEQPFSLRNSIFQKSLKAIP